MITNITCCFGKSGRRIWGDHLAQISAHGNVCLGVRHSTFFGFSAADLDFLLYCSENRNLQYAFPYHVVVQVPLCL